MLLDDLFLKLPIEIGIQNERLTDYTGVFIFLDKEDNVLFDFYAYRCENCFRAPDDEAEDVLKKWSNDPDVISYFEPVESLYYSDLEKERFVTIDYFIDNIYYEQTDNKTKESVYTKKVFPKAYFMDILKRGLYYEPVEDIDKQLENELRVLVETLDTAKDLLVQAEQTIEETQQSKEKKRSLTRFEEAWKNREEIQKKEKGKDRGFGLGR